MTGGRGRRPSTGRSMPDVGAFTLRACTVDDVETVLALVRADEERVSARPSRLVEGDIRDWWQSIDLAANSWLLIPSGSEAAAAVVWLEQQGNDLGITFPIAARQEALQLMVDVVECRTAELGLERLPQGLLADRGFREVRRFFEMAIELDGPPPAVVLPDGFTLEVATREDAPAFHATIDEAFQGHWEHHPLPFDERWQRGRPTPTSTSPGGLPFARAIARSPPFATSPPGTVGCTSRLWASAGTGADSA
jgi:hypothetical protein